MLFTPGCMYHNPNHNHDVYTTQNNSDLKLKKSKVNYSEQ